MIEIHGIAISQEPEECVRSLLHPEEPCPICGRKVPLDMVQFHPGPQRDITVELAGIQEATFDLFGHLFVQTERHDGIATYKHTEFVERKKVWHEQGGSSGDG